MTQDISLRESDWLDALGILRRYVGTLGNSQRNDVSKLWHNVHFAFVPAPSHNLFTFSRWMGSDDLFIQYAPSFRNAAKVERVEALLFAAVNAYYYLYHGVKPWEESISWVEDACQRVGCFWKNTASISERWRQLDMWKPYHSLDVYEFEDRKRCQLCHTHVATGHQRTDVHDECLRYAHRVLLPALRAQREEQAARKTGETNAQATPSTEGKGEVSEASQGDVEGAEGSAREGESG